MAKESESRKVTQVKPKKRLAKKKAAKKAAVKKRPTTKKVVTKKRAAPKVGTKTKGTVTGQAAGTTAPAAPVSADQRHKLIAEAAYLRAAARGFAPGDPLADWLDAEREIDRRLAGAAQTQEM